MEGRAQTDWSRTQFIRFNFFCHNNRMIWFICLNLQVCVGLLSLFLSILHYSDTFFMTRMPVILKYCFPQSDLNSCPGKQA